MLRQVIFLEQKICFKYCKFVENTNRQFEVNVIKMSSLGKIRRSIRPKSKVPDQVQDYGTRKEMKDNEASIRKGKRTLKVSIGLALLALAASVAVWPIMYK